MSNRGLWEYADQISAERKSRLANPPKIDELIDNVAANLTILCVHNDRCRDHAGFSRPVASIELPEHLFDLVFNSSSGYRGWYFKSPFMGLEANSKFVRRIADCVLSDQFGKELGARAAEAFGAHSAKLWLAEVGNEPDHSCSGCEGQWSPPQDDTAEILNGRWELGTNTQSRYGRKAPALTKLRLFGAFLDDSGNEFISWRKRNRAAEIFEHGWS